MKKRIILVALSMLMGGVSLFGQKLNHYVYDHDTIVRDAEDNLYKVENLGENINSNHIESGSIISPDGNSLYFFKVDSTFHHGKKHQAFHSDIYVSHYNKKDSSWSKAEDLGKPLNGNAANSVQAVVKDGNMLILTGQYLKNGLTTKGISYSTRKKGKWSFPKPLHIHFHNDAQYSMFVNNDATTMILAVHDKESIGLQDLFVAFSQDGIHWSKPKNLGPTLNTINSEATAFMASDGKTLYFSSNGHPNSVGGLDIYKTERLDSTWTNWSKPVNMGVPFNTPDNEFYFTIPLKGEYSYLAHHFSGSDGAEHSDIVRIKLKEAAKPKILVLSGFVHDDDTKKHIEGHMEVHKIKNGAFVTSDDADTTKGYEVQMPIGEKYELTFSAPHYKDKRIIVDASQLKKYEEKTLDVFLEKAPELTYSGIVINAKTGKRISARIDIIQLPDSTMVFEKNTDKTSTPSFEIILKGGKNYMVTASNHDYLEGMTKIVIVDLVGWESRLDTFKLQPLEEDIKFEIEDIFFAYNKATLLPESTPKLEQLVSIMKKHTNIVIELSAHTDARGSATYNKSLSQRRAESTVKYLVKHGVPAAQFVAKGYGEEKIRNQCTNGVKCSDEDHKYNRRVEFKILEIKKVKRK